MLNFLEFLCSCLSFSCTLNYPLSPPPWYLFVSVCFSPLSHCVYISFWFLLHKSPAVFMRETPWRLPARFWKNLSNLSCHRLSSGRLFACYLCARTCKWPAMSLVPSLLSVSRCLPRSCQQMLLTFCWDKSPLCFSSSSLLFLFSFALAISRSLFLVPFLSVSVTVRVWGQ